MNVLRFVNLRVGRWLLVLSAGLLLPVVLAPMARSQGGGAPFDAAGRLERVGTDVVASLGPGVVPDRFFLEPPSNSERNFDFRNAANGTILVFPEVRQVWHVYLLDSFQAQRTGIAVRNLDTMALVRSFVVDTAFSRMLHTTTGGDWIHTVDHGKRVFFSANDLQDIVEIDFATFSVKRYPFNISPVSGRVSGARLGGLSYDPHGNALLGLFSHMAGTYVANVNTLLLRRDLRTGNNELPRQVRACSSSLPATDTGKTYALPILVRPEALFVPCQRAGLTSTVVRLDRVRATDPTSDEEVAIGPVALETALADNASGRLFMITTGGEIWAFDAPTMSFLGVIPAFGESGGAAGTPLLGYGLDHQTGRVYFVSRTYGLGVVEGRFFPVPQARMLASARFDGQERIWSDPNTNRVFVLEGNGFEKDHRYRIYRVDPAPEPPPPTDPDRNTLDIAEQPGVTERRFFASATGYGARVVFANGVSTVAPAPAAGGIAPTAKVLSDYVVPKCGFSDRELLAGRVSKAEYDTGSTAASAVAVGIDDRTKLDLEKPSRCDVTLKDGGTERFSGLFATAPLGAVVDDPKDERWTVQPATCSSSLDKASEDRSRDESHTRMGDSTVSCPAEGGKLEAAATATLIGPVSVGTALSEIKIIPGKGTVTSMVHSVAKDIGIAGGLIQIAEVTSTATSTSTGRPANGPMSVHSVEIKGLTINGTPICGVCDSQTAVAALNRVAAGRAQFRIAGGLDAELLKGSPKGALTAVQKSVQRQASDQALVGDFTIDVPGLEMIVYNDNIEWGRARQLYQFAGVASSATYNVNLLPVGNGLGESEDEVAVDAAGEPIGLDNDGDSGSTSKPGIIGRILDAAGDAVTAVARGIRFLLTNRREALLIATAWGTLALPFVLARRRRALTAL